MSVNGPAEELDALDRGIAALEQQRETLGDAVADAALRPLQQRRERLAAHPGDRRKLVTVLFSDLVDSTPLTAALGDEVMREIMGRYFALWREAVEEQGGHVQKFIGDAVVGVFGMHRAHEDDAHRAVRAAISVQPALARLAEEVRAEHGVGLRTRVGIDTGEVVLGSFDERGDGDVVVVGSTMNRAARLQTAAPPDGILLSASTARHVRGSFGLQAHGELSGVRGRAESTTAAARRHPPRHLPALTSRRAGSQNRASAPRWSAPPLQVLESLPSGEPGQLRVRSDEPPHPLRIGPRVVT